MTTTSDTLVGLIVAALKDKTGAGRNIYTPRTWPTSVTEMPALLVQSPTERKVSLGKGPPQFDVTAVVRIEGRLTGKADSGDAGAAALQAAMAILQRQIEVAVINDYDLHLAISEYSLIEAQTKVSSEGEQPIGELTMDFHLEFYQGPEDFAPTASTAIEEFAIYSDYLNVFDAAGGYSAPPVSETVADPPRTSGPDGRIETTQIIEVPQD